MNSFSQIDSTQQLCDDPNFHAEINSLWTDVKPSFQAMVTNSGADSYNLYNLQSQSEPLLRHSFKHEKYNLTDELLTMYSQARSTLTTTDKYRYFGYNSTFSPVWSVETMHQNYSMWVDGQDPINPATEDLISSSQFLALVSYCIREISLLDSASRTTTMNTFVSDYLPVLNSHYNRWIFGTYINNGSNLQGHFQRRGWGCAYNGTYVPTMLTHKELIERLSLNQMGNGSAPNYCNTVTDKDLWIITGVSNYMAAFLTDSALISLKPSNYNDLQLYLSTANTLLQNRTTTTALSDFDQNAVTGALFGKNDWDAYPDHNHANNSQVDTLPANSSTAPGIGLGWDISHGTRFYSVFTSLNRNRNILGMSFPDANQMEHFANQFAYGIFNQDFEYPTFSNFSDGTDGWYRVGYANRPGFGIPPSGLAETALKGMYAEYRAYNDDIDTIMTALYNLIHYPDSTQRQFVIDTYEKNVWSNDVPVDRREYVFPLSSNNTAVAIGTKKNLLSFYSSICDPEIMAIPLPYSNYTFQLSRNNCQPKLYWKIIDPSQLEQINIQRANSKNNTFVDIKSFEPKEQNEFVDYHIEDGQIAYYRLEFISQDNTKEYSLVKAIPLNCNSTIFNTVNLYPNPASSNINIAYQAKNETNYSLGVVIYDVCGRICFEKELKSNSSLLNYTLNIEVLNAGTYFLKYSDKENGYSGVEKFSISK